MSIDRTPPGQRPKADAAAAAAADPKRRRRQLIGGLVIVVIVVTAFSSCIANASRSSSSTSVDDDTSKYTQTWPESYSSTTCDDWNTQMTSAQQFAAAADMLSSARDKGDGGTGVAPDALISDFESGITNVCVEPTMTLTDAGAGLYLTERTRYRP